ncbi:PaaI family thioesterase [Gemmobacter serpentinus]|uniref:PaaI family thioesterase n=1 Tax=Gemmobacter serpentinus TaxID=2652247 RepID=UPI00124D6053|nr:PaaI family thioesterase [Gemmobacter serpentinus]
MTTPFIAKSPADLPTREQLLAISGLDFMRAMLEGRIPHPTIAGLMGYHLTSVEAGRVALEGSAGFEHTNPFGGVHGGWYGTLLDTVLGCTVMTGVPKGRWYTTLEYKVNINRALPIGTEVEAVATLDHAGRSTAVAHGEIRGKADGRLYATGSTTCIILGAD